MDVPIQITNTLVRLHRIRQDELPQYMKLYQDPEFMDDFGYIEGIEQTEEQLRDWFTRIENSQEEIVYSVYERTSLSWMGFITLMDLDENEKEAWIVIGLESKWRNRGYGTQVLKTILETAFIRLGLEALKLSVLGHNERAISVYERLGFEVEIIYPRLQCPNLFDQDIIQFQLTNEKWRQSL